VLRPWIRYRYVWVSESYAVVQAGEVGVDVCWTSARA
jgi:hypothetical protein